MGELFNFFNGYIAPVLGVFITAVIVILFSALMSFMVLFNIGKGPMLRNFFFTCLMFGGVLCLINLL